MAVLTALNSGTFIFAFWATGFWFVSAIVKTPGEITVGFGGSGSSVQEVGEAVRLQGKRSAIATVFAWLCQGGGLARNGIWFIGKIMALDHYVSQVHLKQFYSPALNGKQMYGTKKRTLETFPCMPKDVCRIPEGNTNKYLQEPRIVEDVLQQIEPNYDIAIRNCREGKLDADTVFTVAGFASYILTCAPASMRLNSDWLAKTVETTAIIMDQAGHVPPPPEALGGSSMEELIEKGKIRVDVDGKYLQALGVINILDMAFLFGNADWDILINEEADSPFFTSDFPVAIEQSKDPRILNRLMPLAPDLAVRICPKLEKIAPEEVMNFPNFHFRRYRPNRQEIRRINQCIVQCAEEQVYYRDDFSWVRPFIKKNAEYWIEPITARIPTASGELIWSSMRIARRG